jgi:hypothetical protein
MILYTESVEIPSLSISPAKKLVLQEQANVGSAKSTLVILMLHLLGGLESERSKNRRGGSCSTRQCSLKLP